MLCLRNMGALFRIRIIQSVVALSIIGFAGFSIAREVLTTSFEATLFYELWPSIALAVFGLLFLFFRKTLMLPAILIGLSAILFFTKHLPLSGMWIGLLLVLLAYPVFFYKYLDFKQMLSMLRLLVFGMLAAGSFFYLQTQAKADVASGVYLAMSIALLGNFLLLLNRKKSVATGLLLSGWTVLCYYAFTINDFMALACLLHFPLFWLCLHHDTENAEVGMFSFAGNPYFRAVALVLLSVAILSGEAATVSEYLLALN